MSNSSQPHRRLALLLTVGAVVGALIGAEPARAQRHDPVDGRAAVGVSAEVRIAVGLAVRAQVDCRPAWRHPVRSPIVDGFRPPAGPFGPGNRGLEYGTEGGEPVEPVAEGTVGFAAPVGGRWFVVVAHPSAIDPGTGLPLRSTYGPVTAVVVDVGDRVEVGQAFASAGTGFHLTARIGDRYQDPGPLLRGPCRGPRLVVPDRR